MIAIDEAQFFPDLVDFCTAAADSDEKLVLVAGLDGDFMRQQFGQACPPFVSHDRLCHTRRSLCHTQE